jgi:PPOX class probable F420-dependent enzyme
MAFALTDQIEKHLTDDQIVWLTTVTPSGRPAPRPVWFLWNGNDIVIYSQPGTAKLKHIAESSHVSLNFNCTPGGGDVVVISGQAQVASDAPPPSGVPGLLDKYRAAIAAMGSTQELYDAYNVAIKVIPERSWTI